jgi:hypothetical protein
MPARDLNAIISGTHFRTILTQHCGQPVIGLKNCGFKNLYSVKTGFHTLKTGFRHFFQQRIRNYFRIAEWNWKKDETSESLNIDLILP